MTTAGHSFRAFALLAVGIACLAVVAPSTTEAAVLTVTTLDDEFNADGDCSLREAVDAANNDIVIDACGSGDGFDSILFDAGLEGTILLELGEIVVSDGLSIEQDGPGEIVIDAGGQSRVFSILAAADSFLLRNVTLRNGFSFDSGGAVILDDIEDVVFREVQFEGNRSENNGGAVYLDYSTTATRVLVADCRFHGNSAPFGQGGGVYLIVGTSTLTPATIRDTTFKWNAATKGAAFWNVRGVLLVDRVGVVENTAETGSAIDVSSSSMDLINTTVAGNLTGGDTGGIKGVGVGNIRILHSSIVDNQGAGVTFFDSDVDVGASILADNELSDCVAGSDPFTSYGYNVFGDGASCLAAVDPTDLANTDPQIQYVGLIDGTWAAVPGPASPALETIPAVACNDLDGDPLTIDQRGFGRPYSPSVGFDICDSGAIEYWFIGGPTRVDVFDDNFERGDASEWSIIVP